MHFGCAVVVGVVEVVSLVVMVDVSVVVVGDVVAVVVRVIVRVVVRVDVGVVVMSQVLHPHVLWLGVASSSHSSSDTTCSITKCN